ncbi:YybH family protein [Hymenobacter sp. BRD67]|uniref:YybH family protein n=1 Tax=Hymenobacter sp. BRD67 TaxID=2675877 RepID=UPI0015645B02|nr:nuclear transport factor 2 family protein [Hymenobacter sp. BRD67]QKG51395.1 nuclear transport factor 2 family protein [Hymenobacter sp. BRD67]
MNQPLLLVSATLLFYHQPGVGQSQPPAAKTVIARQRAASNAAIARHDVAGIARYWLPDFVQVGGNGGYRTGADSVFAGWQKAFQLHSDVRYVRRPHQIAVNPNGLLAWETGTWTGSWQQGGYFRGGGNYSAMWRKKDKEWKLQAELYVTLESTTLKP